MGNASIQGIYSVQEAARLLRVDSRKVGNWANGYTYKRKQDIGAQLPVLQSDRTLPKVINFRELFELMAVRDLRKLDVKLETIRSVSRTLSEKLDTPYPFASEKIFRDGNKLLVQHGSDYIQPDTGQIVMERFSDMVDELTFEDGVVEAWKPKLGQNDVIVDPNLLFGDPAVVGRRLSTRTIMNLFKAEKNLAVVAEEYDLTTEQVEHVIRFELSLAEAG